MADDRWRGEDWRRPDEDRYRYGGPGFGRGWQGYGQGIPGGVSYGQSYGYGQGGYGQGGMSAYEQRRGEQGPYGRDYYGQEDGRPWSGHGGGYPRSWDESSGMRGWGQRYGQGPDYRREQWRGYPGEDYQGSSDWRGRPGQERGFFSRAADEIASWVGDENAERRRHMDRERGGGYRGRGPRGYTRSDERIREDVNDCLTYDPFVDASEITVVVDKGEVTLNGIVQSREERRLAEDLVENVAGVKHVQNNVRVKEREEQSTGEQSASQMGSSASAGRFGGTTPTR